MAGDPVTADSFGTLAGVDDSPDPVFTPELAELDDSTDDNDDNQDAA